MVCLEHIMPSYMACKNQDGPNFAQIYSLEVQKERQQSNAYKAPQHETAVILGGRL
jgi:hypothetical protein